MIHSAYIRSQSLDNISPDPTYDISSSVSSVEDIKQRQLIAYASSKVTELDKRLSLRLNNIVIYKKNNDIVINLNTDDHELDGRKSGISVFIEKWHILKKEDWENLRERILKFAEINKRMISSESITDFMAIEEAYKKKALERRRRRWTIGLTSFASIAGLQRNWMKRKERKKEGARIMGLIGALLDNQEKRKILMVLSRDAFNTLERKGCENIKINPNISIIQYNDLVERHPDKGYFIQQNVLLDEILMQSPYDVDAYLPANEALYSYSIEKHNLVSELYQLLGCTHMEITQIDIIEESKLRQFEIQLNQPAVLLGGKVISNDETRICSGFEMLEDYSGSLADIDAAEIFLQKMGLSADKDLTSLVRKRRNSVNKLKNYKKRVTLSSESRGSLDVLVGLYIPSINARLDTSFQKIDTSKIEYVVTYLASFY